MKLNQTAVLSTLAVLALVVLVGCSVDNPFSDDSPTAPRMTITTLAGTCRAITTDQIVCEDNSSTDPLGRIRSIAFHLRDDNGLLVETRTASPSSAPPRQIEFTGLAAGTYQVEHVVEDTEGNRTSRTYRNLRVS